MSKIEKNGNDLIIYACLILKLISVEFLVIIEVKLIHLFEHEIIEYLQICN